MPILEQYRISDFLQWYKEKKLTLNPDFQRGSVWTPPARSFLIDTILRDLPIPKIYLRTKIDVGTKSSSREVVDGQQRLRCIIDFAHDKFALSKRANEFVGRKFSTLDPNFQQKFLSYPIAVDQLINATDEHVLEVFSRLNSYSVQLNEPEKRHARYQSEFKWAVRKTAMKWSRFWDEYQILTVRERVRMLDDSLVAEMYGILLEGLLDGGQVNITKLYKRHDKSFERDSGTSAKVDKTLKYIEKNFAEILIDTKILKAPHFLILFAATAHGLIGLERGDCKGSLPTTKGMLTDLTTISSNLIKLASVMDSDEPPDDLHDFWKASSSSTQRISSRELRFRDFCKALKPKPI